MQTERGESEAQDDGEKRASIELGSEGTGTEFDVEDPCSAFKFRSVVSYHAPTPEWL